jgi:phytoene dehydrogenase-like protein
LTCAALLAQARLRVTVVEALDRLGGFCATGEVIPGYRAPLFAHWLGPIDPNVVKALKLQKFGLTVLQQRLGAIALSPDGRHILLDAHARRGTGALAQHSQADAKAWGPFDAAMRKLAAGLGPALAEPPLRAGPKGSAPPRVKQDEAAKTALAGLALRSIAGLAEENFELPPLQGALALEAVMGTGLGPRTPGGALALIERLGIETVRADVAMWVQGGPGALISALSQAAQSAGAILRTGASVRDLIVENGQAAGVALANGESLYAKLIVSSLPPAAGAAWPGLCRAAPLGWRETVATGPQPHGLAKLHLALRGAPQFNGLDPKDLRARLLIAESLDQVGRAFDQACAGTVSENPPLEVVVPSAIDPSLTPRDGHVLSALIPFAPLAPREGWKVAKNTLTLAAIAVLARYAPDLPNRVLSAELETPEAMARIAPPASALWRGVGQGPAHETNPYGGPVGSLYFCGTGTHPRLGASGLNGRNCAEAILALTPLGQEADR